MDFDLSKVSPDIKDLNPHIFNSPEEAPRKPSKYRNVRTSMEGMSFDSGKESVDAQKFILGVRAGEWIAYLHHVRFSLPGGIHYEADHVLINNDLTVSVYDSKGGTGTITREYLLKKKLFKEKFGIEIKEI